VEQVRARQGESVSWVLDHMTSEETRINSRTTSKGEEERGETAKE